MIFNLYPRVLIKLGDERYVFDRSQLMFRDVVEIEKVTGLSYAEWERELARFSITAVAALVHVLRKRAGIPSDFATLDFAAADLDTVPLHDDDSEFTPGEIAEDLARRLAEAGSQPNGAGPTLAADVPEAPSGEAASTPRQLTSLPLPASSGSVPGNGKSSRTRTGSSSRRTSTGG